MYQLKICICFLPETQNFKLIYYLAYTLQQFTLYNNKRRHRFLLLTRRKNKQTYPYNIDMQIEVPTNKENLYLHSTIDIKCDTTCHL